MGRKHQIVVTYLEMRSRPVRHVPTPAGQLAILRARHPPIHYYRYLYDTVGGGYVWVERARMSDTELAAIIGDDAVEIYVLNVDGVPAGFGELDFRRSRVADIAYFGLMPEVIGRGFGRYFLDQLLTLAWRKDIDRVTVNTCTLDHPAALPLYQRFGFEPVARVERELEGID